MIKSDFIIGFRSMTQTTRHLLKMTSIRIEHRLRILPQYSLKDHRNLEQVYNVTLIMILMGLEVGTPCFIRVSAKIFRRTTIGISALIHHQDGGTASKMDSGSQNPQQLWFKRSSMKSERRFQKMLMSEYSPKGSIIYSTYSKKRFLESPTNLKIKSTIICYGGSLSL